MLIGRVLAIVLCMAGALDGGAQAQDFYANKTITMIIGGGAGAGFDLYGRALARHYGNHIPGRPNIVVQNMPAAGSVALANHMYARAPRDGLTIGMIFPGVVVGPLLDEKIPATFKPAEFLYLGSANVSIRVCATYRTSKTRTFDDALVQDTTIGANAPGGSLFDYAYFLRNELKAKFNIVRGYPGSNDIVLAMERGEVEGLCGLDWSSLQSQRPHWIKEKAINVILQAGIDTDQNLAALGAAPMWNYVKDAETRAVLELIVSQQVFGRPFMLPPETPKDRVDVLRKAFDSTMADPAFLAEAAKMSLDIAPASGARVQGLVEKLYAAPVSVVSRARKAMVP
jgi:tripartite-type tricarboxylate transporter receptor subunit TctC